MPSKSDPQNQQDRIRKLEQQVADFERLHEVTNWFEELKGVLPEANR